MTRKVGAPPSLTREQVIRAGLEMADEVGMDAVSIRKLAARLDKTPMTLYTYISSIQDLREGILAYALTEVDADPIPGERWDDTIRRSMHSIRDVYARHGNADLYKVEEGADSLALQDHTDRIFALHRGQGIPEDVLAQLWCIVDAFLTGFICSEAAEMHRAKHQDDYPVHQWDAVVQHAYTTESFDRGIDIIIAGIRALAAPDACEWYTPA